MELKINIEKTKVMAIGKGNAQVNIKIGQEKLEQVQEFRPYRPISGAVISYQ